MSISLRPFHLPVRLITPQLRRHPVSNTVGKRPCRSKAWTGCPPGGGGRCGKEVGPQTTPRGVQPQYFQGNSVRRREAISAAPGLHPDPDVQAEVALGSAPHPRTRRGHLLPRGCPSPPAPTAPVSARGQARKQLSLTLHARRTRFILSSDPTAQGGKPR